MARPIGDFTRALLEAAREPGTVTQLAHRSLVRVAQARYTACRMVDRGQLVVLTPGRPAVLALPETVQQPSDDATAGADLAAALAAWR